MITVSASCGSGGRFRSGWIFARIAALAAAVTLGLACTAVAARVYAPQKPTTVQMPRMAGLSCSVTEYGPKFLFGSGITMNYGGGVSCASGAGLKTLHVYVEVQAHNNPLEYFIVSGSSRRAGPVPINPLRISLARTAFLGHAYRVVAVATVTLNGKSTGAAAVSRTWAP